MNANEYYPTIAATLLANSIPEPNTGCWIWLGGTVTRRYSEHGYISFGKYDRRYAHRESYKEYKGPIFEGLDVHHRCKNSLCVNPEHLELLTHEEHARLHHALDPNGKCKHGHELKINGGLVWDYKKNKMRFYCKECGRIAARKCYERKRNG